MVCPRLRLLAMFAVDKQRKPFVSLLVSRRLAVGLLVRSCAARRIDSWRGVSGLDPELRTRRRKQWWAGLIAADDLIGSGVRLGLSSIAPRPAISEMTPALPRDGSFRSSRLAATEAIPEPPARSGACLFATPVRWWMIVLVRKTLVVLRG